MLIVVAEPDVLLRFAILAALQREGHSVLHAASPELALRLVQESTEPVDLFLASSDFPGEGGVDLCRQIVAYNPATRVLVMSDRLMTRKRLEAERWQVLQKPFSAASLRERVRTALSR